MDAEAKSLEEGMQDENRGYEGEEGYHRPVDGAEMGAVVEAYVDAGKE